jgi:TonB family protein
VFRIAGPPEESRCEPTLEGAPRLAVPDPAPLGPPERFLPDEAREPTRWYGPVGSLAVHLLPLLLLIEWPLAAPPEVTPIAVQLVVEPPPPEPTPKPLPPKPEFKPPPPGPIASEDIGDTEAKEASRHVGAPSSSPDTPSPPPPEKIEQPPSETPQQTADAVPPPPPEKPEPPKPQAKPTQTAQLAPRRVEEPNTTGHRARYPGPAATRDEYLAYVHSLIRQHYNLLPLSMIGGRRGLTLVEFIVLDDGTIAMIKVRQSSGYPDIDERVEQMVAAVRRVPPLPQWFQGPSMGLILSLPFPEALHE